MAFFPVYSSYECVICHGTKPCPKCQIKALATALKAANDQIRFLTNDYHEALTVQYYDKIKIGYHFDISNVQISFLPQINIYNNLSNLFFGTITFDPSKFGSVNPTDKERMYILKSIYHLRHEYFMVYGCFERHKSGTTHAHFVMTTNCSADIKRRLKKQFTNAPRNEKAVQLDYARMPSALMYINKIEQDKQWFFHNHMYHRSFDEDWTNPLDIRGDSLPITTTSHNGMVQVHTYLSDSD
jgi:hypothetical protein